MNSTLHTRTPAHHAARPWGQNLVINAAPFNATTSTWPSQMAVDRQLFVPEPDLTLVSTKASSVVHGVVRKTTRSPSPAEVSPDCQGSARDCRSAGPARVCHRGGANDGEIDNKEGLGTHVGVAGMRAVYCLLGKVLRWCLRGQFLGRCRAAFVPLFSRLRRLSACLSPPIPTHPPTPLLDRYQRRAPLVRLTQ